MAISDPFATMRCVLCGETFDQNVQSSRCPHDKAPPLKAEAPAKPSKTMRVVLINANWFDIPQPAEFSVVDYVMTIRACGYILNPKLYVPLDQIQSIFTYEGAKPPDGQMVFPENMTKQ